MAERVHLEDAEFDKVKELVRQYGLRPVVDAVGGAALELLATGQWVKDEYGNEMDREDVEKAVQVLAGDLY